MSQSKGSNVIAFPFNRRKSERISLKDFLKIAVVLEDDKITPLTLLDVSDEGCAFRMEHQNEAIPSFPKEIKARFYFNEDTFISLSMLIRNSRSHVEDGQLFTVIGCYIDPNSSKMVDVYQKFISFLKFYSENAQKDVGNTKVSYL